LELEDVIPGEAERCDMTVEELFLAALDQPDATARARYLDTTCAGDDDLRRQVEGLLAAHFRSGEFLDIPAGEQIQAGSPENTVALQRGDASAGDVPDDATSEEDGYPFLSPSARPDSLGRIGHYEVLQVLGKGGFGIVFRAFDELLQRVVAIKVMAPQLAATSPARKRFLREARTSAAVRHENVVQVYEVAEQPLPYLAMEFIPGETLQQRLNRTGPLDVTEALRIGRQIAEGLAAAHANDLIHRDIKPANILIDGGEGGHLKVKITDFGLARAADDASISQSGLIAGTPMYMAPEQALGHKLDQRADLFSLGSVMYQIVAGRPPFRANGTLAVLKRVAEDAPRDLREIIPETPHWLCAIIAKLHAKNPIDRYQTAREVADVLADCESQLKGSSKLRDSRRIPTGLSPLAQRRGGRARRAAIILGPLAAVLLLAGIWCGPWLIRSAANRVELEILPGEGLTEVLVMQNDDGVVDGNASRSLVTNWLPMKQPQSLSVKSGQYQINIGTWPEGTFVAEWEVTRSDPFGSRSERVPFVETSSIVAVARGERVTLRPVMRGTSTSPETTPSVMQKTRPQGVPSPAIAPFDAAAAKRHQEAWARYLGVPVEFTNGSGMSFRLIPPGEFTMGSTQVEIEATWASSRFSDDQSLHNAISSEGPAHRVVLSKPFYLGVTEVTRRQFKIVTGKDWATDKLEIADAEQLPVEGLSWNDTADFCSRLSTMDNLKPYYRLMNEYVEMQTGNGYRLPREAEWEFACRAGTTTRFWFGDDPKGHNGREWLRPSSGNRARPVGSVSANPFGLSDMHGNVREWCQDGWNPEFYLTFKDRTAVDPLSKPQGNHEHMVRGGSWASDPAVDARAPARRSAIPRMPSPRTGFRVALSVESARQMLDNRPHTPREVNTASQIPSGIEFVRIPKGKSWLGGSRDTPGDKEVEIPADFYLGKYEITQEQWEGVMGENPSQFSRKGKLKDLVADVPDADLKRFPVENVSWEECQAFLAKLNRTDKVPGWVYRLPTETEWEYACRGGPMADRAQSAFDYYFAKPGNTLDPMKANAFKTRNRPCPVGTYEANPLGLYDMHGNVAEFCVDFVKALDGKFQARRGGHWFADPDECRAVSRSTSSQTARFNSKGLRVARVPESPPQ
jgi:eukaryotic-like serine/threonine-protein kinase